MGFENTIVGVVGLDGDAHGERVFLKSGLICRIVISTINFKSVECLGISLSHFP